MATEKEELQKCYEALPDDDRAYLLGVARSLAERASETKLPSLTLVVGGRSGVSVGGGTQRPQDRIAAFRV